MPFLFALPSWIEVHGAVTHFPIALLIVAAAAEFWALLVTRSEQQRQFCRQGGLVLLALAVASALPAILSGYLYGRNLRRAPLEYDLHWKMAVVSTVLGGLVLIWRLATRDQLKAGLRATATFGLLAATLAVGYTGKLGGQMVFGDDEAAEPLSTPPAVSPNSNTAAAASADKAAQKMDDASRHLDLAADKMLLATGEMQVKRATQAAQAAQAARQGALQAAAKAETAANRVPTGAATPYVINGGAASGNANTDSAARLEKVAGRFEAAADKLDRAAARLRAAPPAGTVGPYEPLTPQPTLTAIKPGAIPTPSADHARQLAEGLTLLKSDDLGCLGCHKLAGAGGKGGPDLDGTGTRHPDVDWQFRHLKNPSSEVPKSRMPSYDWNDRENASLHLTPEKLRALATYLATLK